MQNNLLNQAISLQTSFSQFISRQNNLGRKAQEKIKETSNAITELVRLLEDIDENYLSLENTGEDTSAYDSTNELMKSLPPGRIDGSQIQQIIEGSNLTFNKLRRGLIDIQSLYKFSENELMQAKTLGQNFKIYENYWAKLRYIITNKQPTRLVIPKRGANLDKDGKKVMANIRTEAYEFCKALRSSGLISDSYVQFLAVKNIENLWKRMDEIAAKDEMWADWKGGWKTYINLNVYNTGPSRVIIEGLTSEGADFINGIWFEAYIQHLFEDMMRRLNKPYEVYTRVKYVTNLVGGGVFKGELDVIAATGNTTVIAECKAGLLRIEECQRILERRKVIRDALKIAHANDIDPIFILVHAPREQKESDLVNMLEAEGVEVFDPPGLVGFFSERF